MLAEPVAVSSFTMAEQMEADGELAAQLVVFTYMISVITIFIYLCNETASIHLIYRNFL